MMQLIEFIGVNDGARTHDNRNHNPGLYRLSYAHHNMELLLIGALGRTRTCDPRLRRPVLYPVELQALNWSGWRDSNPRHPAPKAGALPNCATPRFSFSVAGQFKTTLEELTIVTIHPSIVNHFLKKFKSFTIFL